MNSSLLNPTELWLSVVRASDEKAFQTLLSTVLKPGIDPSSFTRGEVVTDSEDPSKVSTMVKVARARADVSLWPFTGSIPISYKRIKLQDVIRYFGDTVRVDLPTTVREAMTTYFSDRKLHNRADQILDAVIPESGRVQIQMDASSPFMEGVAELVVKPYQRNLEEVLTQTTIDGFRTAADMQQNNDHLFLFNQIVAANPDLRYPLEFSGMVFDQPQKLSGYARDNTTIRVTATGDDGFYKGGIDIVYTRHDFGWSTGGNQHYVEGPSIPTTQYMIDQVTQITGFHVSIDDVIVESYPSIEPGELETLTIFFKPESLRYAGELTIDYRAV